VQDKIPDVPYNLNQSLNADEAQFMSSLRIEKEEKKVTKIFDKTKKRLGHEINQQEKVKQFE
jgi:hypothetical protein